ncbi:hypothetical protein [Chelatococcus sp. YT9]|uniref:hypothetical protein n=1 Tax=Chelatococcus sp. YT9 TaxID=2835635 RepID=UPI001BCE5BF3|nr:hypothetical protein [Chelatococcus sp. YT9]MBS7698588.1 hypothetical protein [Chelatococcus sp. YT9]
MSEPRYIDNDEAARLFRVRLPAIPMSGIDAHPLSEDIRYRSLVAAAQLVIWDLLAAGHHYGQGELALPDGRLPIRIDSDVVRSSSGSPAMMCAEHGRGAGSGGSSSPSRRSVSLPHVSILAEVQP